MSSNRYDKIQVIMKSLQPFQLEWQERDMPMLEELAQHINRFHEDHLEPIQDPNLGYDDYPIGFDDMYDYDGALEDVVEGDKEEEYFMWSLTLSF